MTLSAALTELKLCRAERGVVYGAEFRHRDALRAFNRANRQAAKDLIAAELEEYENEEAIAEAEFWAEDPQAAQWRAEEEENNWRWFSGLATDEEAYPEDVDWAYLDWCEEQDRYDPKVNVGLAFDLMEEAAAGPYVSSADRMIEYFDEVEELAAACRGDWQDELEPEQEEDLPELVLPTLAEFAARKAA